VKKSLRVATVFTGAAACAVAFTPAAEAATAHPDGYQIPATAGRCGGTGYPDPGTMCFDIYGGGLYVSEMYAVYCASGSTSGLTHLEISGPHRFVRNGSGVGLPAGGCQSVEFFPGSVFSGTYTAKTWYEQSGQYTDIGSIRLAVTP
jgi:hypothetical protein